MVATADDRRSADSDFAERVRCNQARLAAELRPQYDFVVCGSGSSGSVVAGRLAEDPDISVLLLEAGPDDDVATVMRADHFGMDLGGERDWTFVAQPSPHVNGRAIPMNMGKVLGGGSSINGMMWARGHQSDWDYFAAESGDSAWNYESVLGIYRRIEDWHGAPDPDYRGTGGPVFVEPARDPNPIAPAALEGARSVGIPTFENQNGRMMEEDAGASIVDLRARNGIRQSVFRSYVYPYMDRPNLTVLTDAQVTRVTIDRGRVTGVEFCRQGSVRRVCARGEVVLSLGAIHTPKVLMQSGIGAQDELQRFGIPLIQCLPGVGQNLQDHPRFGCVWEYQEPLPLRNNGIEATFFAKSDPGVECPDLQACLGESARYSSTEIAARFGLPEFGFTWAAGVVRPKSRGKVRLTGPDPNDPVRIEAGVLSHPDDMAAAIACVQLCREIGNSTAFRPYAKREVMPGKLTGAELEEFARDAALSYWHQTSTAKMGRDDMAVVDAELKVYGVKNLRIADGSIMPRVTTGNTMAPCVVIGERAAEMLKAAHAIARNAAAGGTAGRRPS
jgi:choline dehydrogenase